MYNRDKIIQTMRDIYTESKQIGPYVVIGQPRRVEGEKPAQHFDGHVGLHVDLHGFSHGFCNIFGEKVDVARNYLMMQAIESGAKYLFFIGEDTVVPYDAFKILHKTAEENPGSVVVGVYYIKISDAMIMQRTGNWITVPDVSPGQVLEAWQTGMDCMLIPIDILKEMNEEEPELPFCCIGNNIDNEVKFIGEDNFFVHRLHKRGNKLLVNTDVQCLHMDLATGNYTAHPSVEENKNKYYTNIPIGRPLVLADKEFIDKRWVDRLPEGSNKDYRKKIQEKLEKNESIKFNMGSGRDKLEGYFGVDKYNNAADIKSDLLELRLPDSCADEILASHVLEHIPQHKVIELLHKWHSALKETGKLVIEVPNLEEMCKDFENATDDERFMITVCIYGAAITNDNEQNREDGAESPHIWGYYPKVMCDLLEKVGYSNIQILPQQGLHPGKNFRVEAMK